MAFDLRYYMEHSGQLTESTLGQLKNIVIEHPYFQIARILYLKNLLLLEKLEFDYELKKSAPYIYNRPFLYDFLFVHNLAPSNTTIEPEILEKELPVETNEKTEELIPELKIEESPTEDISVEVQINVQEEKDEKQDTKRNFSDNIKKNISGLLDEQIKTAEKETDELEITQFQMDIEKEYGKDLEKIPKRQETFVLLEDDHNTKKIDSSEESEDKKRISASVSYAKDLLEFDYVLRNNIQYQTNKEEEPDTENQSEKSFTEWLDSLNNSDPISEEAVKEKEEEQQVHEVQQEPDRFEIKNQIIDNFIKTNPALRPEDKPFEFEDISTHSIKEDDDLITDTLARIYYNQGRYDKALEAYKKLSLKYPEKNSYFATQIKKIQNKLNDLK